jgi:hypothetical protein
LLQSHLAARHHPLIYRLRLHRTGDPAPEFRREDVVLFWLGDPLDVLYPECYRDALALEARARGAGAVVLNPPDALCRTSKLKQSGVWRKAGVPCARAWGFESFEELFAELPNLPAPFILRHDRGHSQQDVVIGSSVEDVRAMAETLQLPVSAIELIDVKRQFEEVEQASLYSRYYHKKRAFVFCDAIVNSHVFFSRTPLVSLSTSTFTEQARWTGRLARTLGLGRDLLEETAGTDKAFFAAPPDAPDVLHAAMRALGLDIAAIDYASTPDGGVIVWEANPYFHLPHGSRSVLASERDAVRRVDETVDALALVLTRLLDRQADAVASRPEQFAG